MLTVEQQPSERGAHRNGELNGGDPDSITLSDPWGTSITLRSA